MTKYYYRNGDITRVFRADAIITAINPGGDWVGGVDRAIMNVAGRQYHDQALIKLAVEGHLDDKQIIVAKKSEAHPGSFNDVIFVVDALASPLSELLLEALTAAKNNGCESIAIPVMRTGVMIGKVEKDAAAVVDQMKIAFDKFKNKSKMTVTVVVYNDPDTFRMLLMKM